MTKLVGGLRSFIRSTIDEMTKCTWPTKDQVLESTLLVIIALVITSIFVAGVDQIYKVGGAQVSGKHGNFIINATGLCRTADIKALARSVKRKVYAKCGIKLKEEVEYIPYSGKKSGKRKAKE